MTLYRLTQYQSEKTVGQSSTRSKQAVQYCPSQNKTTVTNTPLAVSSTTSRNKKVKRKLGDSAPPRDC